MELSPFSWNQESRGCLGLQCRLSQGQSWPWRETGHNLLRETVVGDHGPPERESYSSALLLSTLPFREVSQSLAVHYLVT